MKFYNFYHLQFVSIVGGSEEGDARGQRPPAEQIVEGRGPLQRQRFLRRRGNATW